MNEIRSLSNRVWEENILANDLETFFDENLDELVSAELKKKKRPLVNHLNKIVTKICVRFGQTPDWSVMSKVAHKVLSAAISLTPADYDRFTPLPGDVKKMIFSNLFITYSHRLVSKDFRKWWDTEWNEHHKFYWVTPPSVEVFSFQTVAKFFSQCPLVDFKKIRAHFLGPFLSYFSNVRTMSLGKRIFLPSELPLENYCPKLEDFQLVVGPGDCPACITFPKTIREIKVSCTNDRYPNHLSNLNILFPDSLNSLSSLHINLPTVIIEIHKTEFPQLKKLYLCKIRSEPPVAPLLEELVYKEAYMDEELDLTRYPLLRKVVLENQDIETLQVSANVEELSIKKCKLLNRIVFHGSSLKTFILNDTIIEDLDLRAHTQLEVLSIGSTVDCQVHLNHIPIQFTHNFFVHIDYGPHKRQRL